MMRLNWMTVLSICLATTTWAQQTPNATQPAAANQAAAQNAAAAQGAVQPVAAQQAAAPQRPFPPLDASAAARLNQLLTAWQQVSKGTKTLETSFERWHYDMFAAPAGVHASKATGSLRYAAPDKGLFKVEQLMFFQGMQDGKPQFGPAPGKFGEHWVCNGRELIEFDRGAKKCTILELPPNMQGTQIFNSPLPFVFNLDAAQIQKRYWIREVKPPENQPNIYLIEAWPKWQEDRAQYKLVQVALDKNTFLPTALIMYAPNFNAKTAPKWDHYEFSKTKRNGIGAAFMTKFIQSSFIPAKPPSDWQIVREKFTPPAEMQTPPAPGQTPVQQAANPAQATQRQ